MRKRLFIAVLVGLIVIGMMLTAGNAAAGTEIVLDIPVTEDVSVSGGLSNEAAEEGYIYRAFGYPGYESAPRLRGSISGDELSGREAILYQLLKEKIAAVANGEEFSTEFEIPVRSLYEDVHYTADDLGVTELVNGSSINSEAYEAFQKKLAIDYSLVMRALLFDCPYDLYWFDKTAGFSHTKNLGTGYENKNENETLYIYQYDTANIMVKLCVSADYSASGQSGTYSMSTNNSLAQQVQNAVANAQQIINAHESQSDYRKLVAYKEEICDLTGYNKPAAQNSGTPYGDPWQLIYVFDGNPETTVVCEGYSKAFQYLCDQSYFYNDISVISVTGYMIEEDDEEGEGHMWNIVQMADGRKYIADITNSDGSSIGSQGGLFLSCCIAADPDQGVYVYRAYYQGGSADVVYAYDEDTIDQFQSKGWLTISEEEYTEPESNCSSRIVAAGPDDDGDTLILEGTGAFDGYDSLNDRPWNGQAGNITRVVVESGITALGKNVLAGLPDGVRINFNQSKKPALGADTFGTTKAVCRYFDNTTAPESWFGGGDDVRWIDLPAIANSDAPLELRFQENAAHETEWAVGPRSNSYFNQTAIRADQAKEITYRDRWVVFQAIPTAAEDLDVYEELDAPTVLLFMEGTSGNYSVNFTGKPAQLRCIESRSWGELNLTVTAPAENLLNELVVCDGNQITYTGNVSQVTLKTTQEEDTYPTVTVNGNVGEVTYYDATSDSPFTGTLTVSGTIAHGTVRSMSSLVVPGISATDEPVQFGDIATYTFENVQQPMPVITLIDVTGESGTTHKESRLSIGNETIQPTQLSLDKFSFSYSIHSDRVAFDLNPKEGTGLGKYSASIKNILAEGYNPEFTTADIIQGPDTVVYVLDTGTGANDPTIEFGEDNSAAMQTGVDTMYLQNCKVKVNWPVSQIMVWQESYKEGPVVLEANGQVGSIGMFLNQAGGRIYTGENGAIDFGYWDRGIRGIRNFNTVGSGVTVADNGNLCVMSVKEGESIMAVLADDASVTAAAGNQAGSGTFASMDVRDATQGELNAAQDALGSYLTEHGLTENDIVSVFDVSVSTYRQSEGDILTWVEDIHELNSTVDVSIANSAGDNAQVVRLHNGVAEEMENKAGSAAGTVYQFESDRFSTYALVVKAAQELLVLELPAETKTIEAEAFKGIAATMVIIPVGCKTIGERAFAESSVQIAVVPTGVSIGKDAFPTETEIYTPEAWETHITNME